MENLKGVILAGGTGSRLGLLTKVTNKHLLPVGDRPMVYWPLQNLLANGIGDILVVTGPEHMGDMVRVLGSGAAWSARLTYRVQDMPGGIAQALALAEGFAAGQPIVVILADNFFHPDPTLRWNGQGAKVHLAQVTDPQRYGVPEFEGESIRRILEKPTIPPSKYAVTGFYLYNQNAFNFIRRLQPSARGELEITDLNNIYAARGQLQYEVLSGAWFDAGTPEGLLQANMAAGGFR